MDTPSRPPSRRGLRVALLTASLMLLVLLAGIIWAAAESSLSAGMRHLLADRWGIVTLVDIYAGVFAVACWIRVCERNTIVWLLWVLGMLGLGHLVSVAYLLYRCAKADSLADVFSARQCRADAR